jgi:hypothetical protein
MGLDVNFLELSRNIELLFEEKICELSSQDGEPSGASVHGGLAVVVSREACQSVAHRRCRARELTAGWGKRRGTPRVLTGGNLERWNSEMDRTTMHKDSSW